MAQYKEEAYDPVKGNRMIDILENLDPGEWIKAKYLGPMCGVKETLNNNFANVRTLARQVTKFQGIPIVTGNKGFKIANSEKEVDEYVKRLFAEVKGHHERIDMVKLAWDIYHPGDREGAKKLLNIPINKPKPKRIQLLIKPEQQLLFDKTIDYGMEV